MNYLLIQNVEKQYSIRKYLLTKNPLEDEVTWYVKSGFSNVTISRYKRSPKEIKINVNKISEINLTIKILLLKLQK